MKNLFSKYFQEDFALVIKGKRATIGLVGVAFAVGAACTGIVVGQQIKKHSS